MNRSAMLSHDGRYRWRLDRKWGPGGRVLWIMLNPSTADGEQDDPTIRKCVGFSQRWGCGGLVVCNLAPHRATDPRELPGLMYEDGQDGRDWKHENRARVLGATEDVELVVAAWGAHAATCDLEEAAEDLLYELVLLRDVHCIGRTKAGLPRHPLMVAYSTPLELLRERHRGRAR